MARRLSRVVEPKQNRPQYQRGRERADENRDLLVLRGRANQETGLQILRRGAAVRSRDADDAADRKRRDEVVRAGPADDQKIKQVSSNVATVMPEIGFDEEPISPVSRDETVTNRKPNATIRIAPSSIELKMQLRRT